jgi:hypothetical protein
MDRLLTTYDKWKLDTKDKYYGITIMSFLEYLIHRNNKKSCYQKLSLAGNGELLFNRYIISVWDEESSWDA